MNVGQATILTPGKTALVSTKAVLSESAAQFNESGRTFVLRPDQLAVSETDEKGASRWTREFPNIITSASVVKQLSAWGLLDGSVYILDNKGSLSSYSPDMAALKLVDSNNACAYGVGISPGGDTLLILYGHQPQYLVALTRNNDGYKIKTSIKMKKSVLTSSQILFSEDGYSALVRSGEGLIFFDARRFRFSLVGQPHLAEDARIVPWMAYGFAVLADGSGKRSILAVRNGLQIARLSVADEVNGFEADASTLKISTDSSVTRMELSRR